MRRKLQIFVSSTYKDLIEERQAAVEAILNAGHIPAGMELFSAGNESQLEVIYRWINESDIYMLILGGRYGSIEHHSMKSYTHLEYEYATSRGIKTFAVVMSETAIDKKFLNIGELAYESENVNKYIEFKKIVLDKICAFFDDTKDIKIAINNTLTDFQNRYKFDGWVKAKDKEEYENSDKNHNLNFGNNKNLNQNKFNDTQLEAISELYNFYSNKIKPLLCEIDALYQKPPEAILNELRACVDHLAKCYSSGITEDCINSQLNNAKGHLVRIIFDCFKYLIKNYHDEMIRFEKNTKGIRSAFKNEDFTKKYYKLKLELFELAKQAKIIESSIANRNAVLEIYEILLNKHFEMSILIKNNF